MKEQLVTFKTAKLAKEKGFDIPCENFYTEYLDDDVTDLFNYEEQRGSGFAELYRNDKEFKYSAPTQSLLQKWLREIHNLIISVNYNHSIKKYCATFDETYYYEFPYDWYNTYEEALEEGLKEALLMIK
jgi:hypothetical protein